ncbi:hypothetical protein SAMN05216312_105316 [Cohnella sp. OV330]|uniref:hypothetical protein n=1 Tax=Cohnella sp. OV330 TaxID=1855288 RepID=UPI0008E22936|nr:hypothetical protein [Cohnella sp. OV330]SFB29400.1 hypothetical protein SAMN05216312_105316 [Cohnella sp. OV330]
MKLSFRILVPRYESEEKFRELLDFLMKHRNAVDEIMLFTEYWHQGYNPLDWFGELCRIMKDRLTRLRESGFNNVGINMLATLGHFDEAWDWLPAVPFQGTVGRDGLTSKSTFCPNSEPFREYIARKYTLVAEAGPSFVWVDDDIRMFGLGSSDYACFCPICIDIYNRKHGTAYAREQLVDVLNAPDGGETRERWIRQNAESIERLLAHIEEAVHRVDDKIELGLMTVSLGISTYTGVDYPGWFSALKAGRARPGGGFFDDAKPFGLVRKAHEVNRQIAHYPEFVRDIQYELENFPFHRLSKSVRITLEECTAAIVSGCNGVAFDALRGELGSLEEYHELMDAIEAIRPRWAEIERIAGAYGTGGMYPALSPLHEAKRTVGNGNWFDSLSVDNSLNFYTLSEIGFPLSMNEAEARGTILSENAAEGYTTEELREMLRGGVLMDGKSLEILTARGLGEYCGAEIVRTYDNGVTEVLTGDPLNGDDAGEQRDVRFSMKKGIAYELKPTSDKTRVLSRLASYTKDELGPVSTVFENEWGGRVAVQGYAPWQMIHSGFKRKQLLRIGEWLCGGHLPAFIDKTLRVVPFVKYSADESGWLILLLNASYDETGPFEVKLGYPLAAGKDIYELLPDGTSVKHRQGGAPTGEGRQPTVSVDNVGVWQSRIFYTQ